MSNKQEKDKLVNRYLEKFEQIPIIRNYPSEDTSDKKRPTKSFIKRITALLRMKMVWNVTC